MKRLGWVFCIGLIGLCGCRDDEAAISGQGPDGADAGPDANAGGAGGSGADGAGAGGAGAGGADAGGADAGDPDAATDAGLTSDAEVDAGGEPREPFAPLACPSPGPLRVVFPPSGGATDQDTLAVRVRAQPELAVDQMLIDGVSASRIDGTDDWTATVPLSAGAQTLTAIALDDTDAELSRATTEVTRLAPQLHGASGVSAGPGNTLYVFAEGTRELVEIDIATGERQRITDPAAGNATLWNPSHLARAPMRNSVVLAEYNRLVEIDVATGERHLVPTDAIGNEATVAEITGLAVRGDSAWLSVQSASAMAASGPAVLSIQLDTGLVTHVSGLGAGTGPALRRLSGIALAADGNSAFVLDMGSPARVLSVALSDGARTLLAEEGDGEGEGGGETFSAADDLLVGNDGELWIASGTNLIRRAADGTRSLLPNVLPQPSGYAMRMAWTSDGARIAALDYRGDAVVVLDPADEDDRTTFGREPVGPLRLDTRPSAIAVGGGRLFYSDALAQPRVLYQLCAADVTLHHVLGDDRVAVIDEGIGEMAFDPQAGELIVQGSQLVALSIADQTTRLLHDEPYVRGRMVIAGGRGFVADYQRVEVAAYTLATGDETILGSASVGTGPALMAPTTVAYDEPRDRLLVVDYLSGVLAVALDTLARETFLPNMGTGSALPYPRHMYLRPAAGEVRIHKDADPHHHAVVLATGEVTPNVYPSAATFGVGSIGEAAHDAELDVLWVFPSGHHRVVHAIDVVTQHGVIMLR